MSENFFVRYFSSANYRLAVFSIALNRSAFFSCLPFFPCGYLYFFACNIFPMRIFSSGYFDVHAYFHLFVSFYTHLLSNYFTFTHIFVRIFFCIRISSSVFYHAYFCMFIFSYTHFFCPPNFSFTLFSFFSFCNYTQFFVCLFYRLRVILFAEGQVDCLGKANLPGQEKIRIPIGTGGSSKSGWAITRTMSRVDGNKKPKNAWIKIGKRNEKCVL